MRAAKKKARYTVSTSNSDENTGDVEELVEEEFEGMDDDEDPTIEATNAIQPRPNMHDTVIAGAFASPDTSTIRNRRSEATQASSWRKANVVDLDESDDEIEVISLATHRQTRAINALAKVKTEFVNGRYQVKEGDVAEVIEIPDDEDNKIQLAHPSAVMANTRSQLRTSDEEMELQLQLAAAEQAQKVADLRLKLFQSRRRH